MTTITPQAIDARRRAIHEELATLQTELDGVSLALAEGDTDAAKRLEALDRRKRGLNAELDGLAAASRGAARRNAQEVEVSRQEHLRNGLSNAETLHDELKAAMASLETASIGLQLARQHAIATAQRLARQLSDVDPRARVASLDLHELSPGNIDALLGQLLAILGMRDLEIRDPVLTDRPTTATLVSMRKKAQARLFDATRDSVLAELRDSAA